MRFLVFSLALAGCATPVPIPPPEYQGMGVTTVAFSSDPATDCHVGNAIACNMGSVVIMPNPCTFAEEYYAALMCHELGHRFKGWNH